MTTREELELAQQIVAALYGAVGEVEPFARFNNPVFRVRLSDGMRILKISKATDGASTRKEALLIERLREHEIPVPDVEVSDLDGARFGRSYLAMRSAGDQTVAEMLGPGETAMKLLREMGTIQARLHCIPGEAFADVPSERINAGSVRKFLESLTDTAMVLAEQRLIDDAELKHFQALTMPPAEGNSLCHSDYHAVQCVVRDGRIAAVVDWESAWIGNPAIDLAITHAYLDFFCPRELTRQFFAGYLAVRAIPPDYTSAYLPVRMAQVLGMLRAWYTHGADAWRTAIEQQKVARAVRLFRLYAERLAG